MRSFVKEPGKQKRREHLTNDEKRGQWFSTSRGFDDADQQDRKTILAAKK